jgi:hypothetical protein
VERRRCVEELPNLVALLAIRIRAFLRMRVVDAVVGLELVPAGIALK